jgi:hypothetical protein
MNDQVREQLRAFIVVAIMLVLLLIVLLWSDWHGDLPTFLDE